MFRLRFLLSIAATLLFSLALCSTTQAQVRTFVSGLATATTGCTLTAPCRTFQQAHDALGVSGGQIMALDSAGYGPVIITKNVTISGEGTEAQAANPAGDGITIATAGLKVVLRSISIEGFGTGGTGIDVSVAVNLQIQNCVINGFTEQGLSFVSDGGKLSIDNSKITNCGDNGITLNGNGGTVMASIGSSRIENNGANGLVISSSKVTIRNSVTSNNGTGAGMLANTSGELNVESCESSNNGGDGIASNEDTNIVRVSRSVVTNNSGYGFNNVGAGTFLSRVDKIRSQHLEMDTPVNITSEIFSNTVEGNVAGRKNGTIGTYNSN